MREGTEEPRTLSGCHSSSSASNTDHESSPMTSQRKSDPKIDHHSSHMSDTAKADHAHCDTAKAGHAYCDTAKADHAYLEEEREDMSFPMVSVILKFLYLLRILICLIPQHGYIQPDEFFQFTEPIAGSILGSKVKIPWEFDPRAPLRNTLFPIVFSGTSFWFLSKLTSDPSAYWLMVLPRLLVTLFSLASDWAVSNLLWDQEVDASESADSKGKAPKPKNAPKDGKRYFRMKPSSHSSIGVCNIRLLFASSYICFTYLTHTFTNSIELVLFSVLIMLTISYHKMTSKQGTAHGLVLGSILSLGLFNRPTFAIFASYPLIWSIIGHPKIRASFKDSIRKMLLLAPSFMITSLVAIISDTLYYSNITAIDVSTLPMLEYFQTIKNNLVLTPINFINYNSKTSNLANHGLHPRYFHFLVNLPILFGVLVVPFYAHAHKFFMSLFFIRFKLRTHNLDMNMMIATTLLSIVGLSFFPHQEARFLIPLLITFAYMYRKLIRWKLFLITWLTFNASLVYMFGFVHQAGVTKSIFTLHDVVRDARAVDSRNAYQDGRNAYHESRDRIHIIFTSMYLPPQYLLNIKDSDANFGAKLSSKSDANSNSKLGAKNDVEITIFDLSVKKFPDSVKNHFDVIDRSNLTRGLISYLVAPSCLDANIVEIMNHRKTLKPGIEVKLLASFFPHFSYETLKQSIDVFKASGNDFRRAFSMNIWKIKG